MFSFKVYTSPEHFTRPLVAMVVTFCMSACCIVIHLGIYGLFYFTIGLSFIFLFKPYLVDWLALKIDPKKLLRIKRTMGNLFVTVKNPWRMEMTTL